MAGALPPERRGNAGGEKARHQRLHRGGQHRDRSGNGLVLKSPDVITIINSVSSGGEQLYLNNYRVWVNEQEIYSPCSQTGSSFGYETYLSNEGANTITISATDADGYAVKQSWTVYYEKGDVTVTISVEATTVGLGYLVPPTDVTVPGGTDLLTMVTQLLSDNGFSPLRQQQLSRRHTEARHLRRLLH